MSSARPDKAVPGRLTRQDLVRCGRVVAAGEDFFCWRPAGPSGCRGGERDPEHPYGHGRAENLGALGEACFLLTHPLVVAFGAVTVGAIGHLSWRAPLPRGASSK